MKILFCGDVVGRAGRAAVKKHIPELRKRLGLDAVIVNGENAASGFGMTEKIVKGFLECGVDVVTGGDHCFDQKEVRFFIGRTPQLLRPGNLAGQLPGKGHAVYEVGGKRLLVIHLHAQLFMKLQANNPFHHADAVLKDVTLGKDVDAIVVDFHGEASSERMALGHYLDGRVSLVAGSHTHVPTADAQVLPKGTGYMTDAGMCGDYNSVIGFEPNVPISGFTQTIRTDKLTPANGEATLCGVMVEINQAGLADCIIPIRIGGRLQESLPK